jgi:hypothetical protein
MLECRDAPFGSEVALPSNVDVRGPAQCGEAKANAADRKPRRTEAAGWDLTV